MLQKQRQSLPDLRTYRRAAEERAEKAVEIGDVVTVGDTDGVVTRIQGRATTIRNWDG